MTNLKCSILSALKFFSLITAALSVATLGYAGIKDGGGGFRGTDVQNWTLEAADQLEFIVSHSTSTYLQKSSDRAIVIEALKNIIFSERLSLSRYGRKLMFEYYNESHRDSDTANLRPNNRIEALNLFFETFKSSQSKFDVMHTIRVRLLHETAHLIGIGLSEKEDHLADVFANDILGHLGSFTYTLNHYPNQLMSNEIFGEKISFFQRDQKFGLFFTESNDCELIVGLMSGLLLSRRFILPYDFKKCQDFAEKIGFASPALPKKLDGQFYRSTREDEPAYFIDIESKDADWIFYPTK